MDLGDTWITMAHWSSQHYICWGWHYMIKGDILLVISGQLSQLYPLPVSCPPQSVPVAGRVGKKEILMLFQVLLSNIKMWACCLLVRPKEEHKQTALKMGNSVLARPSTICQSKTPFWAITSIRVITDEGIFGQCGWPWCQSHWRLLLDTDHRVIYL